MMPRQKETATVKRPGGLENSVTILHYQAVAIDAKEIAVSLIRRRLRLSPCLARVVVELAQLGGRIA